MPRHTISFNLPEEREELATTLQASSMSIALWDISNEIFRPARKHGYSEEEIRLLCEKIGEDAETLIGLLEKKFYAILEENDVKLG